MNVIQRGKAVQIPNSNGAFFEGSSDFEIQGEQLATSESEVLLLQNLGPNALVVLKWILTGVHAVNGQTFVNEYNGAVSYDDAGEPSTNNWARLTGGAQLPEYDAELDMVGPTSENIQIKIVNTDLAAMTYRLFVTWSVTRHPYNL